MNEKIKLAIEEYQCSGCVSGCDISCYSEDGAQGVECGKHRAGTLVSQVGPIFLGLTRGFNRLGEFTKMKPVIFETINKKYYDKYNRPVWKHLDKNGNTLVRGIMPRRNEPFLHIYLGNQLDWIDCLEITEEELKEMD